jgi:hypothetical protein
MLHDRALVERSREIEQIVAVNDSLDARTSAPGLNNSIGIPGPLRPQQR